MSIIVVIEKYYGSVANWIKNNYQSLIVVFLIFSFSLGNLYRHILVLIALFGIYYFAKNRKLLTQKKEVRLLALLFLCLWIPMLISSIDAEYINTTARVTFRYITYFFSGVVLFILLHKKNIEEKLLSGILIIALFWSFDALIQLFTGTDLFGYENPQAVLRLTGMFYPHYHLGIVLSILSPLLFESIRRLTKSHKWAWLLLIPILVAILFGGSRSSWMILVVSVFFYLVYIYRADYSLDRKVLATGFVSIVVLLVIAIQSAPEIRKRVYVLTDVFSSDEDVVDKAISFRLPIWKTAVSMTSQNWINGIGPRGFRYSYDRYAGTEDDWYGLNTGHPHLFVLEVAVETGAIGILGYLIFLFIIAAKSWKLSASSRNYLTPWGISVLMAAFPLASSMAFYANFMSALIWVLTIIFVSQLGTEK